MTLGSFWRAIGLAAWFTVCATGAVSFARAAPLEQPKDKPILTVSGKITITNGGGTAQFDRAMLEGLGMVSFETTTPWYKEPVKFEGVPLARLMAAVGAAGQRV